MIFFFWFSSFSNVSEEFLYPWKTVHTSCGNQLDLLTWLILCTSHILQSLFGTGIILVQIMFFCIFFNVKFALASFSRKYRQLPTIKNQNINPLNVSGGSLLLTIFFFFLLNIFFSIGNVSLMVFAMGNCYKERKGLPLEMKSRGDHLVRCKEIGFI